MGLWRISVNMRLWLWESSSFAPLRETQARYCNHHRYLHNTPQHEASRLCAAWSTGRGMEVVRKQQPGLLNLGLVVIMTWLRLGRPLSSGTSIFDRTDCLISKKIPSYTLHQLEQQLWDLNDPYKFWTGPGFGFPSGFPLCKDLFFFTLGSFATFPWHG